MYVMMLDLVETRSSAAFIASVSAKAAGADVPVVPPHEARESFEKWMATPPPEVDDDTAILMEALFPTRR